MENVVLTVHLILALLLIVVVLLQRSEGGGLGMGATGGVMTGRQAANALSKATWILATGFLITSMSLTVLAARKAGSGSVVDNFYPADSQPAKPAENLPGSSLPNYTPPPPASTGQPVLPPAPAGTAPATVPPAAADAPAPTPSGAPAPAAGNN